METDKAYDDIVMGCRSLFHKKMQDYGTAWRILRLSSIIDQMYIKAWRIRTIESGEKQAVEDSIESEYVGILNYAIMGLVQCTLGPAEELDLPADDVLALYDEHVAKAKQVMQEKNHDYGEVWRQMLPSSLTDLILMKLLRMRSIAAQDGKTLVSEGLDANLHDIINYSVFAQIKLGELV